jgi:hypothetical protein
MNLVNFSGTRCCSRHWAPAITKIEKILTGGGGEALRGAALAPWATETHAYFPRGGRGAVSWMRMTSPPGRHPSVCSYCRGDGHAPVSPLVHRCQDRQHRHPPLEGCAWQKETLDEIWRGKTMWRRRLTMKGLGFSLASWCTLFISDLSWAFMNYRSN